ncbi:MAG: beta-glycosidase [Bacteroidetes bacterium GWF2_42_66]|nr:MAG: beta-glycosidase [Bacteroidetes bacterium GWA2_42_15]OFY01461.1 MAG: beta-glycosidase [Bacteroidetes bacterium GWE2_42_39]OFY43358.1 MAG: beta-glycosidase [Bacteroidetes bacterium GWF2_42_66]HBL77458.1 glycoside hydrolase family 2 [Prolixibacteraceae bacterium]HCR91824.1 glycoside hydrolase family 2 [Prolixibacteraceae bacterium]
MKHLLILLVLCFPFLVRAANEKERTVINLNGTWQFDQTDNAFPPAKFTRTIPVPGLVHLAEPKIEDYGKFFKRADQVEAKQQHNLYNIDYTPRYNWYRKSVFIAKELDGKEAVITIKKSQYVTQVYINGMDMGTSMACYTPVEFPVTKALKFGVENEILIKVGDRVWLPSEAAGGTDKEKEHYLPGIWDDVLLSFTGNVRINRLLVLPSVSGKKVTVKAQIRNFKPAQIFYGDAMSDSVILDISIAEKLSGKVVAGKSGKFNAKRDNLSEAVLEIPLQEFTNWSPDKPFLYVVNATLKTDKGISDDTQKQFGMRDFTRKGKFFYLNGEKIILRGTNVTLQRFFEDPDCSNLVWDREWVKKLLVDYPKQLNWNMMRICVGIAPDFWYDIADEYGLLFQNEWLYWQNHGWDDQIRKEYTDWVWNDGTHPSIAIWDAINENWDSYIGNTLIPELKKLDPTRIWDAGYMTSDQMAQDEMDEPHPYQGRIYSKQPGATRNFYPLGNLDHKPGILRSIQESGSAQLVNEYGWIWLWRNGIPSKLTVEVYDYYLGKNSTPVQNWELQAYWMQLETEWLRSEPSIAGVLAFCYLANNYGYTGDWFAGNIKDLKPIPTLDWFRHAFAPVATFINLTDERYTKIIEPHQPGSTLLFNLAGINNLAATATGTVKVRLIDQKGRSTSEQTIPVKLNSYVRTDIPVFLVLPVEAGGYVLVAEFTPENGQPVISRRFLKVGQAEKYNYFKLDPISK